MLCGWAVYGSTRYALNSVEGLADLLAIGGLDLGPIIEMRPWGERPVVQHVQSGLAPVEVFLLCRVGRSVDEPHEVGVGGLDEASLYAVAYELAQGVVEALRVNHDDGYIVRTSASQMSVTSCKGSTPTLFVDAKLRPAYHFEQLSSMPLS